MAPTVFFLCFLLCGVTNGHEMGGGRPHDAIHVPAESNTTSTFCSRHPRLCSLPQDEDNDRMRIKECSKKDELQAYWPEGERCVTLLSETPNCTSGFQNSYFVLNATSQTAYCFTGSQCDFGEFPTDNGTCLSPNDCPFDKQLYLTPTGHVECDCKETSIYWPSNDTCYETYTQGPCDRGQHLVYNRQLRQPMCQPNPCAEGEVIFDGECRGLYDGPCEAEGTSFLSVHPTTLEVQCECDYSTVHYNNRSECYPLFTRGPCDSGQYLVYKAEENHVICAPNPCGREEVVLWQGKCIALGDECDPTTGDPLAFDYDDKTLKCEGVQVQSVLTTLNTVCRPGSSRDMAGRCRERLSYDSEDQCPPGHVANPLTALCEKRVTCSPGNHWEASVGRCVRNRQRG